MDAAQESLERGRLQGVTGLQKLTATLKSYLELMLGQEGNYVVLLEEHAMKPAHVKATIKRRDAFETALRDFVREGIADGSVARCNPKLAVFVALGALNWVRKWFAPDGQWTGSQIAHALTELIERSIARSPKKSLIEDMTLLPQDAEASLWEAPTRTPRRRLA